MFQKTYLTTPHGATWPMWFGSLCGFWFTRSCRCSHTTTTAFVSARAVTNMFRHNHDSRTKDQRHDPPSNPPADTSTPSHRTALCRRCLCADETRESFVVMMNHEQDTSDPRHAAAFAQAREAPAASADSDNLSGQIRHLAERKQDGLLSEDEFTCACTSEFKCNDTGLVHRTQSFCMRHLRQRPRMTIHTRWRVRTQGRQGQGNREHVEHEPRGQRLCRWTSIAHDDIQQTMR